MIEVKINEEGRRSLQKIAGKKLLDMLATWVQEADHKADASEVELRVEGGLSVYIFSSVVDALPGIEVDSIDASPKARAITSSWGKPAAWKSLAALLGEDKDKTILSIETQIGVSEIEGIEVHTEEALAVHFKVFTLLFERGALPLNIMVSKISRTNLPLTLNQGNPTLFQKLCIPRVVATLQSHQIEAQFIPGEGNITWYWATFSIGDRKHQIEIYPSIAVMHHDHLDSEDLIPGEFKTMSTLVESFASRLDRYLSGGPWKEPHEGYLPVLLEEQAQQRLRFLTRKSE